MAEFSTHHYCDGWLTVVDGYGGQRASAFRDGNRLPLHPRYVLTDCPFCTNHKFFCLATSTDVERAFSRGGLTVSKMRHSLSDESTRAASVLGSWCDLPGAVPRDEIIAVFRDKGKRPKGNNTVVLTSVGDDMIMT